MTKPQRKKPPRKYPSKRWWTSQNTGSKKNPNIDQGIDVKNIVQTEKLDIFYNDKNGRRKKLHKEKKQSSVGTGVGQKVNEEKFQYLEYYLDEDGKLPDNPNLDKGLVFHRS